MIVNTPTPQSPCVLRTQPLVDAGQSLKGRAAPVAGYDGYSGGHAKSRITNLIFTTQPLFFATMEGSKLFIIVAGWATAAAEAPAK
jgi:hypothetical protein